MKHSPAFLALVREAKQHITECTVDEVAAKCDLGGAKAHLIDVREESEWQQGHIPGATHLSKGIIERDIETRIPDKHAEVILYCGGGFRSALAADNLQKMGYDNVVSMAGGWREWVEKKLSIDK